MSEQKKIELKEFTANGVNYKVIDKLSIERWKAYQKMAPRLAYGLSFEELYENLNRLYGHLNKQKFADAAVVCHNMMNGIHGIEDEKRIEPALLICALMIVRENEDLSKWDIDLARQKIDDWTKEGLAVDDFFMVALNTLKGFRETLIESIQKQVQILQAETK